MAKERISELKNDIPESTNYMAKQNVLKKEREIK